MCSDSEKNMSAFADQNHAPSLTCVRLEKLEKLVSKYEAIKLQRQVYVSGRIKAMNESIYYNVDAIHNAISENKTVKKMYEILNFLCII